MSTIIENNIAKLQQRISLAEQRYQRDPNSVQLMAVSKTKPSQLIREAAKAGAYHIGENYLQEALEKIAQLSDLDLCWHFIGPIQSNKTRAIAESFDWVHGVDRLKIARRLNEQRPAGSKPLNICLQLNVNNETSKSGLSCEQAIALAAQVSEFANLRLRGLMAIPEACDSETQQRANFARVRECLSTLQFSYSKLYPKLDTLSIGMSKDMEAAIAEGSTMVRIGTDIFGARTPQIPHQ